MKFLLKNVRIIGDGHSAELSQDILIESGIIQRIERNISEDDTTRVVFMEEAYVGAGFLDVGVSAGEPGYEQRETLESAVKCALAGGFTGIAVLPDTAPVADNQSQIRYIQHRSQGLSVEVFPMGAVSEGVGGKEMADLMDMHHAGAVAFSDGHRPLYDAGLLTRSLQYAQAFGGCIFDFPQEKYLSAGGQIHEGLVSTQMGLKGIPAVSEILAIQRDIEILAYTGGKLHIHLVSTAEGVELVRRAKAKGLQITCSAAIANLCFTDASVGNFDSFWKVSPPLRSESDRQALIQAAADGTIDFLCSNHQPWDEESKNLEFTYAAFGMLGLQTAIPLSLDYLYPSLGLERLVQLWSQGPRRVLGLKPVSIQIGEKANLTFFKKADWVFEKKDNQSLSHNSPLFGHSFQWKPFVIKHISH